MLRVASAKGQSTVLQDPLQRLYPQEISSYSSTSGQEEVPDHLTQDDGDDRGHVQQSEVRVRPQRAAAMRAREWSRAVTACEQTDDDSDLEFNLTFFLLFCPR